MGKEAHGQDPDDVEAGHAAPISIPGRSNGSTPQSRIGADVAVSSSTTTRATSIPPPSSKQPEAESEIEIEFKSSPDDDDSAGKLLPVLIIPGFMSSGLEVKRSGVSEEWEGLRVWLNLEKLGINTPLNTAGGLVRIPKGHSEESDESTSGAPAAAASTAAAAVTTNTNTNTNTNTTSQKRRFSESLRQEHERGLRCKSDWLQHVSLSHDLVTEREGMEIRPIEGLHGVDYLGQHERQFLVQNLINASTYVFGPVIKVLKRVGYTDDNLDAAPYDWRIPPKVLEERDRYFSRTMRRVEDMYRRNNNTPVVLVCHSMGCRICHYFLNFALESPNGGQAWLDEHIHTYMPVGAPHLGAPKALRGIVDGDKMGLDAFVSDEEGLILGRSLGSALFLLPHLLPSRNAAPNVILRTEGALAVTVSPIDCREVLDELGSGTPKIQLQIKYGDKVLRTGFQQPVGENLTIHFSQTFVFPAPPILPLSSEGGLDTLTISLLQPGLDKAAKAAYKKLDRYSCTAPLVWIANYVVVMLKFILFGTYLFFRRVFRGSPEEARGDLPGVQDIFDAADDTTAKLASSILAESAERHLSNVLAGDHEAKFEIDVMKKGRRSYFRHQSVSVSCELHFANPISKSREIDSVCSAIAKPINPARDMARHGLKDTTDGCLVTSKKDEHVQYEPTAGGKSLLFGEGMNYIFDVMKDNYDSDPLGPRTRSAKDPPPVKRVKAIYGVNLPTEVGAVYRRASLFLESGKLQRLHELDKSATMKKNKDAYKIQNGIIMELKTSPQVIVGPNLAEDRTYNHSDAVLSPPRSVLPVRLFNSQASEVKEHLTEGELVLRCGDGTVPYWSLQHCRTWQGACDVSIDEIEGAEHREILANSTFHKILVDYVSQGSVRATVKSPSSLASPLSLCI